MVKRLQLSYPINYYRGVCDDVDSPHHPDRVLENFVGQKSSDSGMSMTGVCADRDLGFEPWNGDFNKLLDILPMLGVRVTAFLFERSKEGGLAPVSIVNVLPKEGGQS